MITVEEATARLLALAAPLPPEDVALTEARGRVLAAPVAARRDQPPFAAAAMDGYALRDADARPGAVLRLVGTAAAGAAFAGTLQAGEAVRILTGAPVPEGATRVVIQEDVTRAGDTITLGETLDTPAHIRPRGADFRAGAALAAPRRLRPADIALAAAMNHPHLPCARRPEVALIATGDELVMPGDTPGPDQIVASNIYGLRALAEAEGARVRLLPIARDRETSLRAVLDLARGADVIVTVGGASVGDHDIVGRVAGDLGLERAFWKIAMRPGKPLMAGRLMGSLFIGLPGNPVSAMVCGHLFLVPVLRALQGLPDPVPSLQRAHTGAALPANGPRAHYMRARRLPDGRVVPFERQDSALLSVLAEADLLLLRPAHAPALPEGAEVPILPLGEA